MYQKEREWEKEFDRQFKGYWRGEAVPDEIKFFIRKTLSTRQIKELKNILDSTKIIFNQK